MSGRGEAELHAPAIVGRDAEVAAVDAFLGASTSGPSSLVFTGEAGMGKTTLWQAAVQGARDRGGHVLMAQPTEFERQLPFAALADLLRDVDPGTLASIPLPQRSAIEAALRRTSATADPLAVAMGFVSVLGALAAPLEGRAAVMVAVDDVHWLDGPTSRVLEFAFRRAADRRICVVLAARTGEPAPVAAVLARVLPAERRQHVPVGPLSLGALHRLLVARLGRPFPRPTLVRLQQASGGNPLVALEIGAALIESGEKVVPGALLPVPESLRLLLHRRIARLPTETRKALLVVSALADADEDKLARALEVDDLEAVLAPAEEAGLLTRERGRFRFNHPLTASTVYAAASPRQLRLLHARLAGLSADLEERAGHLARSADPPDERVAAVLEEAGMHARQRGAADIGGELLALARSYTEPSDRPAAARRVLAAGEAMLEASDMVAGSRFLEESIASMAGGPDRARALLLLATIHWYDDIALAERLAQEALQEAETDRTLQGRIHTRMALFTANLADAAAHHDAAVTLIDPEEDPSLLAYALLSKFYGAVQTGERPAVDMLDRALDLEPDRPSWEVSTIPALWWKYTDDYPRARQRLQLHLRWARESGDASSDAELYAHLAELELWAGDWTLAERYADQSVDAAEQMGQPLENSSHRVQALVRAHLGRTAEARSAGLAGQAASAASDDLMLSAMYRTVLGFAALTDNDPTEAHRQLAQLEGELAAMEQREPIRFRWEPDHVEALLLIGDVAAAEAVLEGLAARHRRLPRPWTAVVTPRSTALVLAAGGDAEGALAQSDAAVQALADLASPFEHGRTYLVHGRLLRRANRRRAAADTLGQAREIFERLPAPLWAQAARNEAARLGLRRDAGSGLTPSEREVASLAAQGLTNRAVAERLFVSSKTVEANLGRVYSKLGIRSRAELGRVMAAVDADEQGRSAIDS
ncbi:MAG: hypothetical protein QOH61_323 [Chloroflexota bacterium]|nr:hypothetical protein [Chloroflexota bacterium]